MFKLSRYFSITSLIAFVAVTILLCFLYPQIILNDLTAIAESKNVAITQAFANSVWPDFATFVTSASVLPPDELLKAPEIEQLREALLAEMAGLSIVKVKLYDSQSRAQGTGLGLAMTQQLVTLMGSQMKVKSEVGQGSTFCFDLTLPILSTTVEQIALPRKQGTLVSGYQGEPRKILVLDDKLEHRLDLENMLVPLGFEVVQAENGQESVGLTTQIQPDLILTDLVMPVMTAFEAVKEIRKRPSLQKTIYHSHFSQPLRYGSKTKSSGWLRWLPTQSCR